MPTDPTPRHVPTPPACEQRLLAAAHELAAVVDAVPGPPEVVGLVDLAAEGSPPGRGERPDGLVLAALGDGDAVRALLGLTAPAAWWAFGLASGARARPLEGGEPTDGTFVHLVARDATAVTLVANDQGVLSLEGPTREPMRGRVPDLCRRALGLPTAPPPCGMGAHIVDLWLHRLVEVAGERPSVSWAEAAALHPAGCGVAGDPPMTPADLVRATAALADQLDWDRYRRVCAANDGAPGHRLDAVEAGWLDAGSFARWLLGDAPHWTTTLEVLDALLPARTADRVFATVRLSPQPPWAWLGEVR